MDRWYNFALRLTINLSVRVVSTLLLGGALVVTALAAKTYLRDRERYQRQYTITTRQRDIADSVRNSVSALQDATLQSLYYLLGGETAYSEAYQKDIRTWQDESGTAGIVSMRDPSASLVRDFTERGELVLTELKQTVSLYDAGSRDAALDRLRKGAALVYLGQARETVQDILRLDGLGADESDQSFIINSLRSQRRLMLAVGSLFGLVISAFVLLMAGTRRRHVGEGVETSITQSAGAKV